MGSPVLAQSKGLLGAQSVNVVIYTPSEPYMQPRSHWDRIRFPPPIDITEHKESTSFVASFYQCPIREVIEVIISGTLR